MTWTYTGDPAASSVATVRWLVGDTDPGRKLTTDEEIQYSLSQNSSNTNSAAKEVISSLMIRFATQGIVKIGAFYFDATNIVKGLRAALEELEKRSGLQEHVWYAGGISRDDKRNVESNDDRVPPRFKRDMHENINVQDDGADFP